MELLCGLKEILENHLAANKVFSQERELPTQTGDVVCQWKEYFEDLWNLANKSSMQEVETGD